MLSGGKVVVFLTGDLQYLAKNMTLEVQIFGKCIKIIEFLVLIYVRNWYYK